MSVPSSGQSASPGAPDSPAEREGPDDRAARIAQLAAELARIQSRDGASAAGGPSDPDRRAEGAGVSAGESADTRNSGGTPNTGGARNTRTTAGGRRRSGGAPRRSGSGGPVAIGSSGTTPREPAEPGGHPEDALGDPEAAAKAICLRLLTGQARPRANLATALRQRGIPDDVAEKVLDRYTELGLIDDRVYAEMFVAAKHRDRALGATALRSELRRKGVDEATVEEAVSAVDPAAERDRAAALIARRVDAAMVNGTQTARRRLVGLLARRGYSAEVAAGVVDEALADYQAAQPADWPD